MRPSNPSRINRIRDLDIVGPRINNSSNSAGFSQCLWTLEYTDVRIYSCNLFSHWSSNCCGGVRYNFSNSAILCACSSWDLEDLFGWEVFVDVDDMETERMASRRALCSVLLDILWMPKFWQSVKGTRISGLQIFHKRNCVRRCSFLVRLEI